MQWGFTPAKIAARNGHTEFTEYVDSLAASSTIRETWEGAKDKVQALESVAHGFEGQLEPPGLKGEDSVE